ncbi:MAG: GAF domain-containing protein [Spirochaetales bacterium]|nr:GAF domain-containing protein [Spirochaetales bacterium]
MHWLYSAAFALPVIGLFYLLDLLVPPYTRFHQEIVTFLFIILSVLILFPARDYLLGQILDKNDYLRYFGLEHHHLDLMARQFSAEEMIRTIFPDLMRWLDVHSGRIAILNSDRQVYSYHVYRNGTLVQGRPSTVKDEEDLLRALRSGKTLIAGQTDEPAEQSILEKNKAAWIQPIVHRQRVLGFVILSEPPRNRYALRGLQMFARKAAVSIQNRILSYKVVDSQPFEQELLVAERIAGYLLPSRIPAIPGYSIVSSRQNRPCIIEFFTADSGESCFFTLLFARRSSASAGLVLAGLLGSLHSFVHRESNITLHRLMAQLKRDPSLLRAEYPVDFLLGELEARRHRLTILVESRNFDIRNPLDPQRQLVSLGWRNYIDMAEQKSIRIEHSGETALIIRKTHD